MNHTMHISLPEGHHGEDVAMDVHIVLRKRCRHLQIRYHPLRRRLECSAPYGTSKRVIERFLDRNRDALLDYMRGVDAPVALAAGNVIPIFGKEHLLSSKPQQSTEAMPVCYLPATNARFAKMARVQLSRLLTEHIEALLDEALAHPAMASVHCTPQIHLRDPSSRWASCAASGKMMFSWRLVFAPLHVVDYVVMHEAAHLLHRNHGDAFWALTYLLCPNADEARHWLSAHGSSLFRYG